MEEKKETSGLIARTHEPENLEGPAEVFDASITSVEAFFIRNHFEVPSLNAQEWELGVEGAVDQPRGFRLEDLEKLPLREVRATMECAGNSRAHLGDRAKGVQWRDRAIGTALWGGVALRDVLQSVGLRADVQELVFVGADSGTVETRDGASLQMPYARSLPRKKALSDEVLIATRMNGEPLTPEHGAPARLVVPGWYGMASVKWLTRILAINHRFDGYFQTEDYAEWGSDHGLVVRRPLGRMAVKSHIGYPVEGQRLKAGETVTLRGFAWGGRGEIASVEISFDGAESYLEAELHEGEHRYAWRSWEYQWEVPQKGGEFTLRSRARTTRDEVQPEEHDWSQGAYSVNVIRPVKVLIEK